MTLRIFPAAVTVSAAVLLAAACGVDTADPGGSDSGSGSGADSNDSADGGSASDAAPPDLSGRQLTVTAFAGPWSELFEASFIEPFEAETGATVNLVPGANAEWLTKLRAAGGTNPPFDVIALTPDASLPAVNGGLLMPLDTGQLAHWDELDPVLAGKSEYDGEQYGVPLTTGSLGLLYRSDEITDPPTDWTDIFDEEYCGHVALPPLTYNPGLEFFTALVAANGGDLSDPDAVDAAFDQLEQLDGCVSAFPANAGNVATVIESGDAWIVPFWDGRAFAMQTDGQPVGFSYPESGPVGALTSYFVAEGTDEAEAAMVFLDYLTAAEYQKPFAEGTWYAAGNDTIQYDPEFDARIEYGPEVYEGFNWVDYDIATPNLNEWQQRWNQIFG